MTPNGTDTATTAKTEVKEYGINGAKIKSKEIYIRSKPSYTKEPYKDKESGDKNKIGSAYSHIGQDVLRGLSFEEEMVYLPDILGVSPKSEHWTKATKEYWANLNVIVPRYDEKSNTGGLRLEIGRKYNSQEDEDFDETCNDEKLKKGIPINIGDYVLYRYCLVYNRVAKSIDDINKSAKIEFYMYSKEEEIKAKKATSSITKKANQLYYSRMGDREWIDWILRVFIAKDHEAKIGVKDLERLSNDEKDIEVERYLHKDPTTFIRIGEDSALKMKAFIEECIAENKLTRIANTDTILMGDMTIGNTIHEAVAFLGNTKNSKSLETLKAQLRLTT